jgi:uncharacterized protein YecT (DUF1311 family)
MFRRHWLLLCILPVVFPLSAQSGERERTILPREWRPDVTAASEWLGKDLTKMQAQQGMNQLSRCLADLRDAELFAIYVRLFERLSGPERRLLLREQEAWLVARRKAAENAVESEGGSLAPYEANSAEMKFTERRIAELTKRLSAIAAKKQ